MALKYLQGFDHWLTGSVDYPTMLRYGLDPTTLGTFTLGACKVNALLGRVSGKALDMGTTGFGTGSIAFRDPSNLTSLVSGFARACSNSETAFTYNTYVVASNPLYAFYHVDNFGTITKHCSLHTDRDGRLYVCKPSLATTTASAISPSDIIYTVDVPGLINMAGNYMYIEAKLDLRTPGSPVLNVVINGRPVVTDLTNSALKNAATNYVNTSLIPCAPTGLVAGGVDLVDDWYVLDLEGTDCNDFLGPIRVGTLRPDGASSPTELTPVGAASNWQGVYKTDFSMANPTVYNNAPSFPLEDRYSIEDMPTGLGALKGAMIEIGVNSTALVSNCKIKAALGVDTVEKAIIVNNDQVQQRQFALSADPSGTSWTKTALDGLEVGFSRED